MSNLKAKDFPKYIRDKNTNLNKMLERTKKENVYLKLNSCFGFIAVEKCNEKIK